VNHAFYSREDLVTRASSGIGEAAAAGLLSPTLLMRTPTASVPGESAGVVLVAFVAVSISHPRVRAGPSLLASPSRTDRLNAPLLRRGSIAAES